jgi:hypothetical protein
MAIWGRRATAGMKMRRIQKTDSPITFDHNPFHPIANVERPEVETPDKDPMSQDGHQKMMEKATRPSCSRCQRYWWRKSLRLHITTTYVKVCAPMYQRSVRRKGCKYNMETKLAILMKTGRSTQHSLPHNTHCDTILTATQRTRIRSVRRQCGKRVEGDECDAAGLEHRLQ